MLSALVDASPGPTAVSLAAFQRTPATLPIEADFVRIAAALADRQSTAIRPIEDYRYHRDVVAKTRSSASMSEPRPHPTRKQRLSIRHFERQEYQLFAPLGHDRALSERRLGCFAKISQYYNHLGENRLNNLKGQLTRIMQGESWEEGQPHPQDGSLLGVVRLITFMNPLKLPSLGCSIRGNFTTAFRNGSALLFFEHKSPDELRWSIGHEVAEGRETSAGETFLTRLPDVLTPYNPSRWFNEKA